MICVCVRVNLERPAALKARILPSSLRHLTLPLLADDSWVIKQHLPNLEYLFFFGFSRSSGYALHENHLSIASLNYNAGEMTHYSREHRNTIQLLVPQNVSKDGKEAIIAPNCPKIRVIEIALRRTDYLAILLRPVIRKLFKRCPLLQMEMYGVHISQ